MAEESVFNWWRRIWLGNWKTCFCCFFPTLVKIICGLSHWFCYSRLLCRFLTLYLSHHLFLRNNWSFLQTLILRDRHWIWLLIYRNILIFNTLTNILYVSKNHLSFKLICIFNILYARLQLLCKSWRNLVLEIHWLIFDWLHLSIVLVPFKVIFLLLC